MKSMLLLLSIISLSGCVSVIADKPDECNDSGAYFYTTPGGKGGVSYSQITCSDLKGVNHL